MQTITFRICYSDFSDRLLKQSIETAMLFDKVFVRNADWVNNTFLINKVISGRISPLICYLSLAEKRQFVFGKKAIITLNANFLFSRKLLFLFFYHTMRSFYLQYAQQNYHVKNVHKKELEKGCKENIKCYCIKFFIRYRSSSDKIFLG